VRGWGGREGKEVRKQPPKAPFSAAFSQIHRYTWLFLVMPVSVHAPSPSPIHVPEQNVVPFLTLVDLVRMMWILGQPGIL
jgi:hypothetical protein